LSASRFGRLQKSLALVPLALLSAAWTASLTASGAPATNVAAAVPDGDGLLPDGSSVPAQAIEAPASVSSSGPDSITGSVGGVEGDVQQIVATSSTNGIPSAALAAYQRAETVINAADESCNLTWQLVAAIGRVESDHGRFGGNVLDADGVAKPGIVGIALDGTRNTALIRDTDAGQFDGDTEFDRAVGPMQFIPSTWAAVGVDADNDGVRNPQDIDDAALATAVYLCSGDDDLSTLTGQRDSVYRYNHSESYVDLVLSIMDAYLEGDFMQVPDGTVAAGYLSPDPTYVPPRTDGPKKDDGGKQAGQQVDPGPGTGPTGGTDGGSDGGVDETPEEPEGGTGGNGGNNGGGGGITVPNTPVTVPALPQTSIKPVDDLLTLAQAIVQCTLDGHIDNLLKKDDPFDQCIVKYTKG
jgi:hypothetical protein